MKKIIITIAIFVLIVGGFTVWHFATTGKVADEGVETAEGEEITKVQVGDKEYYEPEYPDGNDAGTLSDLTYQVPDTFTGILSEDDSVQENAYIAPDSGTRLSISKRTGDSASDYEAMGQEFLDGASDIEEITVGSCSGYRYTMTQDGEVCECDFFILDGDALYSGLMWHPSDEEGEDGEEPEPVALTQEEIAGFDALCDSLAFK